jgi:uncharacterized protein (DUF305 family)
MWKAFGVVLIFLASLPAQAQQAPMPGMSPGKPAPSGEAASTTAYKEAMEAMHKNMMVDYTGNADRDFTATMIPHHQGAIGMAQVELHYGNDPELRSLARRIIADQTREIALMRRWQAKHGQKHAE